MKRWFVPVLFFIISCTTYGEKDYTSERDFRRDMRLFVQEISRYGRARHPGFIVIPQNGQELLTYSGWADGEIVGDYLDAIDGVGREDLYYGYERDNRETPSPAQEYMLPFLVLAEEEGLDVLTIDYCHTESLMDDSYSRNSELDFISFAADRRALDSIPHYPREPYNISTSSVRTLDEAENFLFLINPSRLTERRELIDTLAETWFDILIIDLFDNDGNLLSSEDINQLKRKPNGESRLVISYMSIGEAEDYRYYWDESWKRTPPQWIDGENPHWPGNYKVRYWDPQWQEIILGTDDSYLDLILARGFDGVYLDLIDAFEYYEQHY